MATENNSASSTSETAPALTAQRAVAKAREGFAVDVDVGEAVVRADMPVARGGGGSAPAPGHLMRASIAACLAIGYRSWAAQLGVPLEGVEVDLTTEIDMRGQAGATGVPPGWQRIRWHVRVTSRASTLDVQRVLDQAERLSPMLDCLHPRCERVRTFELLTPT